ncbi:hypothetical protein EVAR_54790_1 [Eumeta japonica]|uniref:Uncharacterized protein n=1 Tax=Eumeta variegata TaxID=151549 RepID=A0A4C1XZC4_EUMVA|nr:hypothetical protein EVAR_54790_1 [Eumeta japonica]
MDGSLEIVQTRSSSQLLEVGVLVTPPVDAAVVDARGAEADGRTSTLLRDTNESDNGLFQRFPKGGQRNPVVPWKGHRGSLKNILTRALSMVVRAHRPVCKRAREGQGVRAE